MSSSFRSADEPSMKRIFHGTDFLYSPLERCPRLRCGLSSGSENASSGWAFSHAGPKDCLRNSKARHGCVARGFLSLGAIYLCRSKIGAIFKIQVRSFREPGVFNLNSRKCVARTYGE